MKSFRSLGMGFIQSQCYSKTGECAVWIDNAEFKQRDGRLVRSRSFRGACYYHCRDPASRIAPCKMIIAEWLTVAYDHVYECKQSRQLLFQSQRSDSLPQVSIDVPRRRALSKP